MDEERNIVWGLNKITAWAQMHPEQEPDYYPGIDAVELDRILKDFSEVQPCSHGCLGKIYLL